MSGSLSVPLLLSLSLVLLWWLLPTPTLQQMPPMPMRVQDKDDSAGPLNAEEECGDLPDGGDPDIAADPQTEACSRKPGSVRLCVCIFPHSLVLAFMQSQGKKIDRAANGWMLGCGVCTGPMFTPDL